MINFINTDLYKEGVNINVIVYSDNKDRAVAKIKALTKGEKILEERENYNEYRAIVEKNNINIAFRTMPLSIYARGHRSQYAIVDMDIIGLEHGREIFYNSIYTKTIIYSHLLKDTENPYTREMQIMLF
ncbi:hypothetical protein ACIQ1D_18985 [Lysinibacillus xylanilyticus]|uniref:hypothetical protein n=1 Tax=Lysinibacillus xylanilyticus TaxID=582475 RepID=UPI00382EB1AA